MRTLRRILSIFTFVGGAIFGLSFAQRRGSDFRESMADAIRKGKVGSALSKEAQGIGKDVWKSALGMKDVKEVQSFINDSQARLVGLSKDAKSYGGDVAKVLSKKYEEISKDLGKEAKELQKAATKKAKGSMRKTTRNLKKSTRSATSGAKRTTKSKK